ncbi:hypothetical protein EAL2_c18810 [Peptoclostridium acidaminophilum DSM 3953]|uniref:Uncharacterized protein n=1 Tax=Peptoclostridium acidaminophilum DSM 3953 TaxID=1286171 RepID=W8TLW6_PEPAC|nr:polysaccharide lyase [Peptoclostridium acidaminophilum]AHM57162.1 hypothetical protein EAL2_c18810 [Peptoclostridium acidaminophilum DSM 3953]
MNIKNMRKGVALSIAAIMAMSGLGTVSAHDYNRTYSSSSRTSSDAVIYNYLNADFFEEYFDVDYSKDSAKLKALQLEVKKLLVKKGVRLDSRRSVKRYLLNNKSEVYAIIKALNASASASSTTTTTTTTKPSTTTTTTTTTTKPSTTTTASTTTTKPSTTTTAPSTTTTSSTTTASSSISGTSLINDAFDSLSNWNKETSTSYGVTITKDPLNSNNNVARFELRDTDSKVYSGLRSEIASKWKAEPAGSEIWYNWKFMVDPAHSNNSDWEILGQWHPQPVDGNWDNADEYVNGRPTISIQYHDGYMYVVVHNLKVGVTEIRSEKVAVKKGQWVDLKTHIKWSQGNDGYIEVLADGKPMAFVTEYNANWDAKKLPGDYRLNIPTLLNSAGDYLKLGSYRNTSSQTGKSIIYYDDLKITRVK